MIAFYIVAAMFVIAFVLNFSKLMSDDIFEKLMNLLIPTLFVVVIYILIFLRNNL